MSLLAARPKVALASATTVEESKPVDLIMAYNRRSLGRWNIRASNDPVVFIAFQCAITLFSFADGS